MKSCSTSHVIREMSSETTMRYCYPPIGAGKVQSPRDTERWRGPGTLTRRWREGECGGHSGGRPLAFYGTARALTMRSGTPVLGVCLEELDLCPPRNLHANVYNSFTHEHRILEATKVSLSRGRITWCIRTVRWHSAWKKKWAVKPCNARRNPGCP